MSDAGSIWFHALSGIGNNIADSIQQYHKDHQAYDEQAKMAEALSRLGVNAQGQITPIDPNSKDKSIQPIIDPKALEIYQTNNHSQQMKNRGALEALNRIGMHMLDQTAGPLRQAQIKNAQLDNQRYTVPTQYGGVPATAGQAIQSGFERERIDIAKKPKGPTEYQKFEMTQKQLEQQQKEQDKLPEVQFQKNYQVLPKDILNQPMGYATQFDNPDETDPAKKKVAGYVPTTPVFRERKYQSNQAGIKQDAYAPDPGGDIVNFKGQRIPYSDYVTLQNRSKFVYDRAKAALQRGTPPEEVAKRLEAMGFDPAGVQ